MQDILDLSDLTFPQNPHDAHFVNPSGVVGGMGADRGVEML